MNSFVDLDFICLSKHMQSTLGNIGNTNSEELDYPLSQISRLCVSMLSKMMSHIFDFVVWG